MSTDTPLTDAVLFATAKIYGVKVEELPQGLCDHAQSLERRNSELTARIAGLERQVACVNHYIPLAIRDSEAFVKMEAALAEARKDSARLESLKLRIREQIGWVDFHHLQSVADGKVELSGDCIRDLRNLVSNLQTLALPATPLPETKEGQL